MTHDVPFLKSKERGDLFPYLPSLVVDALYHVFETTIADAVAQVPVHAQHRAGDRAQVVRRKRVRNEDAAERHVVVVRLVLEEAVLGLLDVDAHDDVDRLAQLLAPLEQAAQRGDGRIAREGVEEPCEGVVRGAGVVEAREEVVDAREHGGFEQGEVDVPPFAQEEELVVAVDGLEFFEVRGVVPRDVRDDLLPDAFEVVFRAQAQEGEDRVEMVGILAVDVVETFQ